jgi:hypothetical protein
MATARLGQMVTLRPRRLAEQPLITVTGKKSIKQSIKQSIHPSIHPSIHQLINQSNKHQVSIKK